MKHSAKDRQLLDDAALERSSIVVNAAMNRERGVAGPNSYERELRLNPTEFLEQRLASGFGAAWLDLCCGSGKALIETAELLSQSGCGTNCTLHGIDLVDMFLEPSSASTRVQLHAVSVATWAPRQKYDLITCVHGLHYVGDKLGLIQRAISWLREDGVFLANLDTVNLCLEGAKSTGFASRQFRAWGVCYSKRKHLLSCEGRRVVSSDYRYIGADVSAGPNYTRQPAVDSYYVAT